MKTRDSRSIFTLILLALLVAGGVYGVVTSRASKSILLQGTIVTPNAVIPDGWILIRQGKISSVSASKPQSPDVIEVKTDGIIFPGLVDLHNHVSYDVFPRWHPSRLYLDRYEWRNAPDYIRGVANPYKNLTQNNLFCDMNTYGELRALVGGTTSILATADVNCIRGLVRNLDHDSGFYGFLEPDSSHIRNIIEIRPTTDPATISGVRSFLTDKHSEMFIVHLSEGIDAASLDEFDFLQKQGLLTRKTVLIHGVALKMAEFQDMRIAGASLVWSPRSNIELYGETADIAAALDAGVRIALAPDWAITGSSNLLDELHYAAQWNRDHLSGRLTDEQLVKMVTLIPAQIAGIDDEVGTIREGLYADLLVISGDRDHPYGALIQAQTGDVQLVVIGGQPIFGAPALMETFWNASELSQMEIAGKPRMVRMPNPSVNFSDLESRLQTDLAAQGISLAPVIESP